MSTEGDQADGDLLTVEQVVRDGLAKYPTLFRTRADVLWHMIVDYGNGYEWEGDGPVAVMQDPVGDPYVAARKWTEDARLHFDPNSMDGHGLVDLYLSMAANDRDNVATLLDGIEDRAQRMTLTPPPCPRQPASEAYSFLYRNDARPDWAKAIKEMRILYAETMATQDAEQEQEARQMERPEDQYINEVTAIVDSFRYELCELCGKDLNAHTIGPDPLGHAHVYCLSEDVPTRREPPVGTAERKGEPLEHQHDGPCQIGLGFWCGAHKEHTGAEYLRRAVEWSDELSEFDDIRGLAQAVLERWDAEPRDHLKTMESIPLPVLHLPVSREEFEACATIVDEAARYWATCEYGADEAMPDDQWLETHAEHFRILGFCGRVAWVSKDWNGGDRDTGA